MTQPSSGPLRDISRRVLLLGCGSSREKRLHIDGFGAADDQDDWGAELVTLDHNADHQPDVVFDLEGLGAGVPLPFPDDHFDRLDAYEVLEHIGRLGDWRTFFAQFAEFYRVLKPGGYLAATCPSYKSMWALGDPSHTRVIASGTLVFLDQGQYRIQVDAAATRTAMSDFRFCWRGDFKAVWADVRAEERGEGLSFILEAVKPSRWESATVRNNREVSESIR